MFRRVVLVPTLGTSIAKPFALREKCLIGRSSKCDVTLEHPSVSRRHALVLKESDQLQVTDLQSRNGTFVDNVRVIRPTAARLGNRLRFGSLEFLVSAQENAVNSEESREQTDPMPSSGFRAASTDDFGQLSSAQRRVFRLLVHGLQEKQIASRLGLSPYTVHNHITAIYRAFRVHSRSELLVLALGHFPPE